MERQCLEQGVGDPQGAVEAPARDADVERPGQRVGRSAVSAIDIPGLAERGGGGFDERVRVQQSVRDGDGLLALLSGGGWNRSPAAIRGQRCRAGTGRCSRRQVVRKVSSHTP